MTELRHVTFGELISSGLLEIGDGYRAKNEELGGTGEIFLRAGHVRDSHIDLKGVERFHSHLGARLSSKMSRPGDTIITTKGNSIGRVGYVSGNLPSFVYSPHLCYWRSRSPEKLSPGFLRFWARSPEFRHQLRGMQASTDMAPYLSLTDQSRLRIALPTVTHQRAVAAVLGALDDKIDLNRRTNETLEEMARALFKRWFVDFDPVHAKAAGKTPFGMDEATAATFPKVFDESPLGRIPKGWGVESLDSIADFRNGLALQNFRPEDGEQRLPVVKIAQLRTGQPSGEEWARADIAPDCIIDSGDVVFSWSGSLMVVVWCGGRAALNQHLFRVSSGRFPKWFYFEWLLTHLPEFQRIAEGKATTMGHIQRHHLTAAKCVVPSSDALLAASTAFAAQLENRVVVALESRTLAGLRDTLLPQLLSGQLRIKDAEKLVGEAT